MSAPSHGSDTHCERDSEDDVFQGQYKVYLSSWSIRDNTPRRTGSEDITVRRKERCASKHTLPREYKHLSKSLGTTRAISILLSSSCHPNIGSKSTSSGTLEEVSECYAENVLIWVDSFFKGSTKDVWCLTSLKSMIDDLNASWDNIDWLSTGNKLSRILSTNEIHIEELSNFRYGNGTNRLSDMQHDQLADEGSIPIVKPTV
ncbi:hypothetical protein EAF04_004229 [Stromatinia cepivora]|nr:hypothetical protein EAF04_004229 [Stromatinia cepivora]